MQSVCRAFTLIELLAVVVILSMTAGMGLVALSSVHGDARLERIGFEWRELDARLRILARSGRLQPTLQIADRGIRADGTGESGATAIAIPESVQAVLDVTDSPSELVRFDTRGCSQDYTLSLVSDDRRKTWRVAGETGWFESLREESP